MKRKYSLLFITFLSVSTLVLAGEKEKKEKSSPHASLNQSCPASFYDIKSTQHLMKLAKKPIDLTAEGVLTPQRIDTMMTKAAPFQFFYATERISKEVLSTLRELAEETEAVKKMAGMQSGEIVNFIQGFESEKRPALHSSMRDFFDDPNSSEKAKEATNLAYREVEKLKGFLLEIEAKKHFTDLIHIGIGGSQLGPEMAYVALRPYHKKGHHVHFFSNVDPDDGARILRSVNLSKTLVVVVSKSGTTIETMTNEAFFRDQFKKAGLDPKKHIVAVTEKGSPMDDPARYLASFYIWDYVGGRFSLTSMVGGVTLSFALGIDNYLDFLRGASAMDKVALEPEVENNLPLLAALLSIWNRNFLNYTTSAIIPYSQALSRFPAYVQQVDMESNGKHIDKCGKTVNFDTSPIVFGEPGTNAQHSIFQAIHQGTTIVPLDIIGFVESQYGNDILFKGTTSQEKLLANLFAQAIALAKGQKNENPNKVFLGNRPSSVLLAKRLDPFTLGALVSFYESKEVFQGFIWNINSFDQEGVQLGKTLANKLIDQFAMERQGKAVDPKDFPLGQAFLKHLF